MGPSLAFFKPSANLRASTSSFDFSASTEARNLASTASVCARRRRAVSSKSTEEGGRGGGTWESTAPCSRSILSLARQQGHSTSKVSAEFFAMLYFTPICERWRKPVVGPFRSWPLVSALEP